MRDEDPHAQTRAEALRLLGLEGGGLPEDEAAAIVAGGRRVDILAIREALMPHVRSYALALPALDNLVARRLLSPSEVQLVPELDGARTVQGLIDAGALAAPVVARLLWALWSAGAVALQPEPARDEDHPRARAVAAVRDHLRARAARLRKASAYDVLEVAEDAVDEEVERATAQLGERFAPERLTGLDLGDLAGLVAPIWQQILRARQTLLTPELRGQHDAHLAQDPQRKNERMRRVVEAADAEAAFVRGQRALAEGDAFRATSELALAARRKPDEPDYEAYAAWARVCADDARGQDRSAAARRERDFAERALLGRRPRPRALFALGLICEAAGDATAAKEHLRAALVCDPRLAPARQALSRLGG